MANIEQYIDPIVAAIYAHYESEGAKEKSRTYLGASIIGKECSRALWYDFRWASKEKFDGRKLRLFQTGHLAEPRFVSDLRAIGAIVHEVDPATGKQFGFVDHGGHARGHMDGCAKGIPTGGAKWHVLEFKTHNDKSFTALKKDGVKKSKPVHYAQAIWYMGQAGLDRCLYLAVNKDTDELYSERIEFDRVDYERLQAKFDAVIFAATPPPKLRDDPKYFVCNMCTHKQVCHGHQVPNLSCRTCVHATPEREGDARWSCAKHGPEIPGDAQREGCADHLPLPFLLTYAEPLDAGDGWIEFRRKDKQDIFVVAAKGVSPPAELITAPCYSSQEISDAKDHRSICDPEVEKYRTLHGGLIVG